MMQFLIAAPRSGSGKTVSGQGSYGGTERFQRNGGNTQPGN